MMLRLSSRRGPHGAISDGLDVATSWRSERALAPTVADDGALPLA